jgi:hypothetical protein
VRLSRYFVLIDKYITRIIGPDFVTFVLNRSYVMAVSKGYGIINLDTGEIEPIQVYETKGAERWEKVYARTLVDMLNITSESKTRIVAYLIKHKDYNNVIMAPVRKIAEETGCSPDTVQRTLKLLEDNKFIRRLQRGVIMFSPHVMRSGRTDQGMAIVRRWHEEDSIR